jgi:hypothetical protein
VQIRQASLTSRPDPDIAEVGPAESAALRAYEDLARAAPDISQVGSSTT